MRVETLSYRDTVPIPLPCLIKVGPVGVGPWLLEGVGQEGTGLPPPQHPPGAPGTRWCDARSPSLCLALRTRDKQMWCPFFIPTALLEKVGWMEKGRVDMGWMEVGRRDMGWSDTDEWTWDGQTRHGMGGHGWVDMTPHLHPEPHLENVGWMHRGG